MQKKGSSSRGTPFFATLYDFLTPLRLSYSEEDTVSSFCETSRILCCAVLLSDHQSAPQGLFARLYPARPRLIQSPAKWIMANCYVRRPPPNQSRLGLRTGFCALDGISGGVWGKNYLEGIFQILKKSHPECVVAAQDAIPITVIAKKGLKLP